MALTFVRRLQALRQVLREYSGARASVLALLAAAAPVPAAEDGGSEAVGQQNAAGVVGGSGGSDSYDDFDAGAPSSSSPGCGSNHRLSLSQAADFSQSSADDRSASGFDLVDDGPKHIAMPVQDSFMRLFASVGEVVSLCFFLLLCTAPAAGVASLTR